LLPGLFLENLMPKPEWSDYTEKYTNIDREELLRNMRAAADSLVMESALDVSELLSLYPTYYGIRYFGDDSPAEVPEEAEDAGQE
jgi:hypothetical protein